VKIVAVAAFLLLGVLEFWLRRRTFQFLRYKGESRIRANRALTHLASEHYLPEGARYLGWLRLVTLALMLSFFAAFWAVVS
jgi:hypothetical protein